MTQRLRLLALLLAGAAGLVPVAGRADDAKPPYVLTRKLQSVQEQVAHGSTAAQAVQAQLLAAMPGQFLAADPAAWREARNARAAVLYLFSGGRPAVIRTVLARSTVPREIDPLLKGALAYAEGQDDIARGLLQPIDPRTQPSALGGHLALVEATLLAATDKAKANRLLDLARLLVPGSLVEEAALRRQIFLNDDDTTLGSFVSLSRQYLHRFRTSIYAQNFKQHLARKAVAMGAVGDLAPLGMLDAVVAELPPEEARGLYLAMARAALVQGRSDAARFAAQRAATIARDGMHDADRAQLYLSAAAILSNDVGQGVAALEAADRARLSPADADLRDAALAVAHSVTRPVPDAAGSGAGAGGESSSAAVVEQARQALAGDDKLLGEVGQ